VTLPFCGQLIPAILQQAMAGIGAIEACFARQMAPSSKKHDMEALGPLSGLS